MARNGRASPLAHLTALWAERDELYRHRPPLTDDQVAAILSARRQEALALAADDAMDALDVLDRWTPPTSRRKAGIAAPVLMRVG